jgi:choline dehydrogenase-like flavoprotein
MKIAVIGSGVSAYAAITRLIEGGVRPRVIDVGRCLDQSIQEVASELASIRPDRWSVEQVNKMFLGEMNDMSLTEGHIPIKRLFGSDFAYERQCAEPSNESLSDYPPCSYAFGGFSTVWGGCALMPSRSDLGGWHGLTDDLYKNAKEVLSNIPYSATEDDLAEHFPLLRYPDKEMNLRQDSDSILSSLKYLARYSSERGGYLVGKSRLLNNFEKNVTGPACEYCGKCMSGCVYDSIFKSSTHIRRYSENNEIDYQSGLVVEKIVEKNGKVTVSGHNTISNTTFSEVFDKVILAAGAFSSTKIMANSILDADEEIFYEFKTTNSFVLPILSFKKLDFKWPNYNTQPSIFLEMQFPEISNKWIHGQISVGNEFILKKIGIKPKIKDDTTRFDRIKLAFAKHLFAIQVNLPGELGLKYKVHFKKNTNGLGLNQRSSRGNRLAASQINYAVARKVSNIFFRARYLPFLPFYIDLSSYGGFHFGGSMPMSINSNRDKRHTDIYGKPFGFTNLHIVDGSVMPTIPATTVGLLIMSNARRIVNHILS